MSLTFRIILLVVALVSFLYLIRKINKANLAIEHSLFWVLFSIVLVILAAFPQIAIALADALGIMSPVNLVFLVILFILLFELFQMTLKISRLENRLKNLVQSVALREDGENTCQKEEITKEEKIKEQ